MNEEECRKLLAQYIRHDGTLVWDAGYKPLSEYIDYERGHGVMLDGIFSLNELEAIVFWMTMQESAGK